MTGQLNLDKKLAHFPALRSRIASATTLGPLSYDEADAMLLHRFETAGSYDPFKICAPRAMQAIYAHSHGVPRDFLTIAEAAMKEAFLRDAKRIEVEHVIHGLRSLAGRQDYIPVFGDEEPLDGTSLKALNRATASNLQEMARYARAA